MQRKSKTKSYHSKQSHSTKSTKSKGKGPKKPTTTELSEQQEKENQKKLEEYLKKQKEYFDQVDQFQLDEVEIDENALMHEELEKEVNFPDGNMGMSTGNSMLTDVDGKKSISIVSRDGINDTEVNQEGDSFLVRMEMPSKIEPIDEEMKKAEEVEMKYVSSK
ncbi:hypothetical protein QTN25_002041 [Entamoeba marina]